MRPLYLSLLIVSSLAGENQSIPGGKIVQPGMAPVKVDLNLAPLNTAPLDTIKDIGAPTGAEALSQTQLPALEPVPGFIMTAPPKAYDRPAAPAENPAPSLTEQIDSGRAQFDLQTAKYPPSAPAPNLRSRLSWLWNGSDKVPDWPGRAGDKVRLGGRTFVLESRLGEGNSAIVWKARGGGGEVAVKFIHPEFKNISRYADEAASLEALAHTDIPHARLLAQGAGDLILVKEYAKGESGSTLLARGSLTVNQRRGLAELAARLIRIGYTADIHLNNILWEHGSGRWVLVDGGGFQFGKSWQVIAQILEDPARRSGAVNPVEFLSSLREKLGPASEAWRRIESESVSLPVLRRHLEELSIYDRSLKPGPRRRSSAAPKYNVKFANFFARMTSPG